jgi:hypothetical protein
MRKILYATLIAASVFTTSGCENWLDVNTNPNGPDALLPSELYLPQIQSELVIGMQWDGRYAAQYTQGWTSTAVDNTFDLHGHPAASDSYSQLWRAVYWSMGYNLSDMIESAEKDKKYDFVGVGHIMRALGWQVLTDYHGEIIVSQAFDPAKRTFEYDSQEQVYVEIKRLLEEGIKNLERTDGIQPSGLSKGDLIYAGDKEKWKKFAYGLLAINAHRLSNKSNYDPNVVLGYLSKAFGTDNTFPDALITFAGTTTGDANWYGPLRNNIGTLRQSKFILNLLNGSNPSLDTAVPDPVIVGETLNDPRITAMMAPATDNAFRGLEPGKGTASSGGAAPKTFWNTTSGNTVVPGSLPVYHFGNDMKHPVLTEALLRFVQAEAELRKGGGTPTQAALDAYKKGVESHMNYARQFAADKTVYDQRKALYLTDPKVVPSTPAGLTLSKILLQKYIASWGWGFGFLDTWSDLRKYHYSSSVYTGFTLPATLDIVNNGNPAYRARPRYNSEYMWNKDALQKIGGNDPAYHTFETWFSKPGQ